jgi:hypothetical protein
MVAGLRTNDLGLVAQCYATLHEGIFKLLDLIEVAILAKPSLLKGHSLSLRAGARARMMAETPGLSLRVLRPPCLCAIRLYRAQEECALSSCPLELRSSEVLQSQREHTGVDRG